MIFYHYGSEADRLVIEAEGLLTAQTGSVYTLTSNAGPTAISVEYPAAEQQQRIDLN
jgi:hypothetical protein